MNECRDEKSGQCCSFHPARRAGGGVCAFCLHERLSILACDRSRKRLYNVRRIFALAGFRDRSDEGASQKKCVDADWYGSCSSVGSKDADSFISLKFEANGKVSWDKKKIPKMPPQEKQWSHVSWNQERNVSRPGRTIKDQHAGRGGGFGLVERLIYSFYKGNQCVCHGTFRKRRKCGIYGWIRGLTKRKAKE